MKNEIKDINEVIIRFLDGTATGEEKVFLFNWLKQSEKNRNEFSEVRDLWLLGNTIATDDLETEIALERFKNRIQSTESGLRKNRFVFRKHFVPFLRVAAVFLMLFTVNYSINGGGPQSLSLHQHETLLFTVTEKFPRMRGQGVNSNFRISGAVMFVNPYLYFVLCF